MFITKKLFEKKVEEAQNKVYREMDDIRYREEVWKRFDSLERTTMELEHRIGELECQIAEMRGRKVRPEPTPVNRDCSCHIRGV